MRDDQFIAKLNRVLAEQGGELPALEGSGPPDGHTLTFWADFLRACVRAGVELSDPRWAQLTVVRRGKHTELALDPQEQPEPDDAFKVGLQLLMGMLEEPSDD
jgi:hypothetical protein